MAGSQGRGPGRPRDPVGRETLLRIAAEGFAAEGYAGASLASIAARAGIRKSSLLHHFESKDALYDEVFAAMLDDLDALLGDAMAAGASFPERLDRLGDGLTHHLATHPTTARLLMRELAAAGAVLHRPGRARIQATLQATVALFADAIRAGELPPQDPGQLVISVVGLHLTAFAAPEVAATLLGAPLTTPDGARARAAAVRVQVRRLCGLG